MSEKSPHTLRLAWILAIGLIVGNIAHMLIRSSSSPDRDRPHVALVTGGVDPFWDEVVRGAHDAADQADIELTVSTPENGIEEQNRVLRQLQVQGIVDGVAVSPIDPDAQADLINLLAGSLDVITVDSDAPNTRRRLYLGTDNYAAGRMCGSLIKETLPDGGEIVISIGSLTKDNGVKRRQGIIDELLERPYDADRAPDPVEGTLGGETYTILETTSDGNDRELATANALDVLERYTEVDCIVGIYAYSIPRVLDAVRQAGASHVKLVGFDNHEATLAGIESGEVYATLVQDAYRFGYDSVRTLGMMSRRENAPVAEANLHSCIVLKKETEEDFDPDE